jgi:hypothetical protein
LAGISVQIPPESVFTFNRNECSRSAGASIQGVLEVAVALLSLDDLAIFLHCHEVPENLMGREPARRGEIWDSLRPILESLGELLADRCLAPRQLQQRLRNTAAAVAEGPAVEPTIFADRCTPGL